MRPEVRINIDFSKCVQEKIAIPKFINVVYPNCKILSTDLQKDSEIAQAFDVFGTTDMILIDTDSGLILMGMRMQRPKYASWKSITLRDKRVYKNNFERASEYQKYIRAIANDTVHANLICHCYVDGNTCETANDILYGVIARTKPLLELMLNKPFIIRDNETMDESIHQIQKFKYVFTSTVLKISRDIRQEIILAELKKCRIYYPKIDIGPPSRQVSFENFKRI